MAEKAIRLGGESTAAAITQAVQELYPEHKFTEAEFARKDLSLIHISEPTRQLL